MKKEQMTDVEMSGAESKAKDKRNLIRILSTVALSVVFLVFYRFSLSFDFFPIVMWVYMIALTALVLVYIIYNRGFSRKGVTTDMLPDEWSLERKEEFVESAKRRMDRSRWMLVFMIALMITFLFDAIELFVFPFFSNLF